MNTPDGGNLIGIDFRPADSKLYGLTDLGTLYTIDVSGRNELKVPTPGFASDPAWSPLLS